MRYGRRSLSCHIVRRSVARPSGVQRSRSERPEPSTIRTPVERHARRAQQSPLDREPGSRGAAAALHGADLLQQHLRVEVVAVDVHVADQSGERGGLDVRERSRLGRRDADRGPAVHADAGVAQVAPEDLLQPSGRAASSRTVLSSRG